MNYQGLKTMIEGLVKSHKCPECKSSITDSSIDIIGAAWSNVNIDIECPSCKKHSMVKTQLLQVNVGSISELKEKLLKTVSIIKRNPNTIKDKEITNLSKDLRNSDFNASDLFESK